MIDKALTIESGIERLDDPRAVSDPLTTEYRRDSGFIEAYVRRQVDRFNHWRWNVLHPLVRKQWNDIEHHGGDFALLFDEALTNAVRWGVDWSSSDDIVLSRIWKGRNGMLATVSSPNAGWRDEVDLVDGVILPPSTEGGKGAERFEESSCRVNVIDASNWFHVVICKTIEGGDASDSPYISLEELLADHE